MAASNPLELECSISHNPSKEEQAIFDYLTTYLPEDSSITPNEAVGHIATLFPEDITDATCTSFIYLFWQLVFCVGSQLDYQKEPMQRFLALLKDLEYLPEKIQGGLFPGRNSHSSSLYFVFAFGDQWNSILQNKNPSPKSARQFQNINGLRIYMHINGISPSASYALETITMALENKKLNEPHVRAAAIWFTMCPDWIFWYCYKREEQDPEKRGDLWTSMPRRGYSISRWRFWRKRFAQICAHPDVEEETAQVCRDAVQGMDGLPIPGNKSKVIKMSVAFLQKFTF